MFRKIRPVAHCVEHATGYFYVLAFSRREALDQFSTMFPQIQARDAWRSSQQGRTLPAQVAHATHMFKH